MSIKSHLQPFVGPMNEQNVLLVNSLKISFLWSSSTKVGLKIFHGVITEWLQNSNGASNFVIWIFASEYAKNIVWFASACLYVAVPVMSFENRWRRRTPAPAFPCLSCASCQIVITQERKAGWVCRHIASQHILLNFSKIGNFIFIFPNSIDQDDQESSSPPLLPDSLTTDQSTSPPWVSSCLETSSCHCTWGSSLSPGGSPPRLGGQAYRKE